MRPEFSKTVALSTVLYTLPSNPMGRGIWSTGPDIPKAGEQTLVSNDCPATLMPNGKVLFTAAPFRRNDWGSPIFFFQYDPISNTIAPLPAPPNSGAQIYWSRLMLLPPGRCFSGVVLTTSAAIRPLVDRKRHGELCHSDRRGRRIGEPGNI